MDALPQVFFFILGAIAASFAGVIAERSYTGQSWWGGRSHCNSCNRTLTARDLVPVLSWATSFGRCRTCRARVPVTYALAELALGCAFAGAYVHIGLVPALVPFLLGLVALAAIVLYDLRHMIVPTAFAVSFIAFAALYFAMAWPGNAAAGFILIQAGGIALLLFLFYALSGGRLMGLGDAPVAFGLSLLAGSTAVSGLILSFWIGAAIGIIVLLKRPKGTRMGVEVPFVPFLAAGFLLATYFGWNLFSFIGF